MRKGVVISVMLWVALSMVAAACVGCKTNKPAEEELPELPFIIDSVDMAAGQSDTTVVDTVK